MITKILFTVLVIVAALIFIRHKNSKNRQKEIVRQAEQAADRRTAMFVAIAIVSLMMMVSGGIYYSQWKEQQRIFVVQIINSHTAAVQSYDVHQSDINGRSFRTINGREIHLSDAERMEVQEKSVAKDHP
jgi:uncharacterized membrane protein